MIIINKNTNHFAIVAESWREIIQKFTSYGSHLSYNCHNLIEQ